MSRILLEALTNIYILNDNDPFIRGKNGTPGYKDPHVEGYYNAEAFDAFSLGRTMYFLVTCEEPDEHADGTLINPFV
jgi:hypothetical protein